CGPKRELAWCCAHHLIAQQVKKSLGRVAVTNGEQFLSYRMLDERANQLAHYLREHHNVGPDTLVGLCVERSLEMMVGVLAILKAGGAYVPLDPAYPKERLAFMVQDTGLTVVLTQQKVATLLDGFNVTAVPICTLQHFNDYATDAPDVPGLTPANLAYVMYTSGSTGTPKGVMVTHRNLVNFAANCELRYDITEADNVLQFSTMNFDIFVEEWLASLSRGASLVLRHEAVSLSREAFIDFCQQHAISVASLPTAFWHQLALSEEELARLSLRLVIVGGEALDKKSVASLKPGFCLLNSYGPTETTVTASGFAIDSDYAESRAVPIGRANANTACLVLSEQLTLCPPGVMGELYISGQGLAKGYLNQPALTAERFIDNPYYDKSNLALSERLYKTGDWVRLSGDGELVFMGRIDDQVKIRGFRVELGEIVNQLMADETVELAVVLAEPGHDGGKTLRAYVQPQQSLDEAQHSQWLQSLQQSLSASLPNYMVPATFSVVVQWPVTTNGKVDKQALLALPAVVLLQEYQAPQSAQEHWLVEFCSQHLALPTNQISVTANFFALGGHSLLIMQLVSQLRKSELQADVQALFKAHSLQDMARQIQPLNTAEFINVPANGIPADCQHITPEMLTLTQLSEAEIADIAAVIPGGMANIQDIYPLAPLQEGVLFIHTMSEQYDPYVTSSTFEFDDDASLASFLAALQQLIARHDVLRTAIVWRNRTTALQVVQREAQLAVSQLAFNDSEDVYQAFIDFVAQADYWIDLETAPLLQLSVCEDTVRGKHYALLSEHHLISDHVSLEVLVEELSVLLHTPHAELAPPVPYREFVGRTLQRSGELDTAAFFSQQLGEVSEPTLPYGLSDVLNDGKAVTSVKVRLDKAQAQQVRQLMREHNSSPAALFHLVWAKVLSVCSGQSQVVFGTVLSGRMNGLPGIERMMGMLINTLPLKVDLGSHRAATLLSQLNSDLQDLVPYEQVSLAEAQRYSGVSGQLPLFSAMLNYRHSAIAEQGAEAQAGFRVLESQERTNYPFNLLVDDFGDGFAFEVQIDTRVPAQQIAAYVQVTLTNVLDLLAKDSIQSVHSVCVLSEAERQQQLVDWNNTALSYPKELCIHELFEAQVQHAPERTAVWFEEQCLSYGELNAKANQLAHYLRAEHGVGPDSLVGLCTERSLEMVIGIWGILKAGGAYVPLDPELPSARLQYLVSDTLANVVLSTQALKEHITLGEAQVVYLDGLGSQVTHPFSEYSEENINLKEIGLTSQHLAYMIYTSGSTGQPKGVLLAHQALHNRIDWMDREYGCDSLDVILQKTPYSFDVSVWEFIWPMLKGAKLVVAKPQGHKDPSYLTELIVATGVTKLHFVPSMLGVMLAHGDLRRCQSLKQVFCSGEALQISHVEQFRHQLPEVGLHNLYGPTEAAIDVSYWDCSQPLGSSVPIGKPIQNIQLYILDDELNLLPQGACGELHIGGDGLARGYLNRPELTQERFIANPFYQAEEANSSERLYKTGDLVRYKEDGNIEYMGRLDHQVKIRGFRIELGEIEYQVAQHKQIDSALVVAQADKAGNQRLIAYGKTVQADAPKEDVITSLKAELAAVLPEYMVPANVILVSEWPLTPNGKIDRRGLPSVDESIDSTAYVAPHGETEVMLAEVWAHVLKLDVARISRNANFFELGGHSLLIMQLITSLKQQGYQCHAQAMFKAVNLQAMADQLDSNTDPICDFIVPDYVIPENVLQLSPDMFPLVQLEQDKLDEIVAKVPGGASNIQDIYPLAPLQEGVLFIHTINKEHDPYVSTMAFELANEQLLMRLRADLTFVIERHDVLRTAILWRGRAQALQVVQRRAYLPVTRLDLSGSDIKSAFETYVAQGAHGFELETAPLIELVVTPTDEQGRIFALLKFHHLITDHVSLDILMSELSAPDLTQLPPPLPYREFIARSLHNTANLNVAEFFSEKLGDIDTPTLPFDLAHVASDGNDVVEYGDEVALTQSEDIRRLAKRHQCSPAALFHLAWAQVLSACCGRDDVVFGTVMSGRMNGMPGIERMMGMLINTLPLRLPLKNLQVTDALRLVNQELQALLPYEQVSLAQAQSYSGIGGNTPLFSAILNYRHQAQAPAQSSSMPEQASARLLSTRERTNYPFELSVNDQGEGHCFTLDFQIERRIEAKRIAVYMQTALNSLVTALLNDSNSPVTELTVLPHAERTQQLIDWQAASAIYPKKACIHEVFEQRVADTPDAIALSCNEQVLSYRQLNERANQVAHYLQDRHQIGANSRVGLCIGRSVEMIIGTLAILKAGAAYVPLDPQAPQSRLAYMLEDTAVSVILTAESQATALHFSDVPQICLDQHDALISQQSSNNLSRATGLSSESLAYVIYTSGSTGHPKGVMTPHRAVNRLVCSPNFMTLDKETVFLQCATIAFDAATLEIWGPLLNGGRCVLFPDELITLERLNAVLAAQQVTAMWLTSGLFTQWSTACQPGLALEYVLAGGDVLNPQAVKAVQQALPDVSVINGYGPTENTTFTCCYPIPRGQDLSAGVPIGQGVQGDVVLILSAQGSLVPAGVIGELCVGGDGLALGYLNQQAQTQQQFVANPYSRILGRAERLYKTGDLVRYTTDGLIEYVGRVDDQIKIRGFRVELGEIQNRINALDDVEQSLVVCRKDQSDNASIVAYIQPSFELKDESFLACKASVKLSLADKLPTYMQPSAFIIVEQWPLTPNGKIDKKALPLPNFNIAESDYIAPESELELQLVEIIARLIGMPVSKVSMSANFFDLGGHSLMLMRLLTEIKEKWMVELAISEVFDCQCLANLAELLITEIKLLTTFDNTEIKDDEEVLEF
ncbi:probable peptide synthetase protein, partial [Pseudoalteromonas tunicata D2]